MAKIIDLSLLELSFLTKMSPGVPTDLGQNLICCKYGCIRIWDLFSAVEFPPKVSLPTKVISTNDNPPRTKVLLS